ncbi:gliding motility-associated C-terminal domain-containing protein [Muricauda sp. SCSIO 65647]|nr:gliding motility-associated C-terminal domain-containing protein [Muricauda sp. SCSIO 65647]
MDYATNDGSAGEPGDYTDVSGTLNFTGNDGESYDITVPIIDDSLIEPTEDFTVLLDNLSTTLIGINGDTATGNILDNDGGGSNGIAFDATSVTVNEGDGTATFTVRLTGNVQGGFTVDYATNDGSAGEPGDYTDVSGTLNFTGNDGESYDITVPIIDDSLIEPTEDFTVLLDNLSTTLIGINGDTATGNILDNDGGGSNGIAFDATSVTVNEGDGTATFTVRLTGNVQGGFTVDYATNDGSAGEPGDYTDVSGTLNFTGNDGESYDITVPIIDDSLIEPTEDFTVLLDNLSTTLIGINGDTATGNILDNDGGGSNGIAFDATSVTVNEGDGTATFTVRLTGNVQGGFTVDYATNDGSAGEPGDYTDVSGTLNFTGNDGESYDITVPIIDDSLIEPTEDFTVLLDNLSTTLIGINGDTATGNILDNDGGGSNGIAFDATSVTVNEGDGTATFTVRLTGNVQGGFTVDYATNDGSAGEPGDYTDVSGTLNFTGNDGESYDITVPIIDDSLIEPTEDFTVLLDNLSTTLIGINGDTATGNILDNDNIPGVTGLSFDSTEVTVDEDAGTAIFTVRLTGDVQNGFTVDYTTVDDFAISPDDYTSTSATLTFAGNDGENYDIIVPIIDDVIVENTESYQVVLSNLSPNVIGINGDTATGNIIDNDSDNDFPGDVTANCDDVPTVPVITLNADGCNYTEVFEETITGQDDGCATEYTITRTWTITDCVDNVRVHVQTITVVDDEAPNFVEALPSDMTVSCDSVPQAETLTAIDNCDNDAFVTFDEQITDTDSCGSNYMITRTWTAMDCAGNQTVHVQTITVEDTEAPVFVEELPQSMTVMCNEVPDAATLTAIDNCDTDVSVTYDETITNDANCSQGYMITRTWSTTDCAGNVNSHTQVITINPTGPITASDYEEQITIMCGDDVPEVPELTFMGGCGNYQVDFTEDTVFSDDTDDYMITRTWEVTDSCGNMATFEQVIFVMQPQLEEVTIEICVEDDPIDLIDHLPESFDTNGVFEVMNGNVILDGSTFNPANLEVGDYLISYSSTEGTCKYYVDFTIKVDSDCVPCGRDEIQVSKTVTANGDGINDVFEITGVEYCNYTFNVMLFNRWGDKVFESRNYENNWGGFSPNNSFGNSGMLPAGTYYYIISVNEADFEPINGFIYLGTSK